MSYVWLRYKESLIEYSLQADLMSMTLWSLDSVEKNQTFYSLKDGT